MYHDSDVGRKVTCGRTKSQAMITGVLGPYTLKLMS
jgi:hypothetical protein